MSDTKDKTTELSSSAVGVLLMIPAVGFLNAWFLMLSLGVLHSQWHQVPAFGYWACYVLAIGLVLVARPFAAVFKERR